MREYCHTYPTCPNCHEPHITGSALEKVEFDELCDDCKEEDSELIEMENKKRKSEDFKYKRDAIKKVPTAMDSLLSVPLLSYICQIIMLFIRKYGIV